MVNETDADRIQRDKDRRRAEERLRIEREHHRRLHDVEALRRNPAHGAIERPARPDALKGAESPRESPAEVPPSSEEPTPVSPPAPETSRPITTPKAKPETANRSIGRPIRSDTLRAFLSLDPAEQFDIEALNLLPLAPLLHEGGEDPELLARLGERSEALMDRVKREVDDPLNAGALLREFALDWYRKSPEQPDWGEAMPPRWGGIFAESKVSGGKLHPWLNLRLWAVHQRALKEGGVRHRFRRGLSRSHVAETAISRTVNQQIQAEVAQAFVDDIASRPRKPETPFPLVRLSELAVRRQVATVNDSLSVLFSSSESGPFVVLHPNRYPDCEEVVIRPPTGSASGAALAFALVTPKGARRSGTRGGGSELSDLTGGAGMGAAAHDGTEQVDAASVWEAKEVTRAGWHSVLEECAQEKRRLDAPPKDYRARPAYASLRELLFQDAEGRKAFLAVKWRGRPSGLPLLVALLHKGNIAPEVATDHEYLEAELGEAAQGDPHFVPEGGVWKIPGWTVAREGSHQDGFRYSAHAETANPG